MKTCDRYNISLRQAYSLFNWLALTVGLLWISVSNAQEEINCPSYSYTLSDQAAVDALGQEVCNKIRGDLTIDESSAGAITTLDPLVNLIKVDGSLVVRTNSALKYIDGLVNIRDVGNNVVITSNGALLDSLGLSRLEQIGGSLTIQDNDALEYLDGFASLSSIGSSLTVSSNAELKNIDGLSSLLAIPQNLTISGNGSLGNIDGLVNVTTVTGSLAIENLEGIRNLDGLGSLVSTGSLILRSNASLADISGLSSLETVDSGLTISSNPSLTDIPGMTKLTTLSSFTVSSNSSLQYLSGLRSISALPSGLTIDNNDALIMVTGLRSLESSGDVQIVGNARLAHLDGLRALRSINDYLGIYSNGALDRCEAFAGVLGWGSNDVGVSSTNITSNSTGCNSQYEVLSSVQGPTQPVVTSGQTEGRQYYLSVTPSENRDKLYPVTNYDLSCDGAIEALSDTVSAPLLDNVSVTRTLRARSAQQLGAIAVDVDISHSDMSDVSFSITSPAGTTVKLWNLQTGDEDGLEGAFIEGTFLLETDGEEDVNGCSLAANDCKLIAFSPGWGDERGVFEVRYDTQAERWTFERDLGSTRSINWRFGATKLGSDYYVLGNPNNSRSPRGLYKFSDLSSTPTTITNQLRSLNGDQNPNAITNDGANLYVWFKNGEVNRVSPVTGSSSALTNINQNGSSGLTFDWENQRLIAGTGEGIFYTVAIDSGSVRQLGNLNTGRTNALAFVGNGRVITAGVSSGYAYLVDLERLIVEKTLISGTYTSGQSVGGYGESHLIALANTVVDGRTSELSLTPDEPLSPLIGESMSGKWQFTIEDVSVGPIVREGRLNSWGVRLKEVISDQALPFSNPIPVKGLTQGQSYSCSIAPVTALGESARSATFNLDYPYFVPTAPSIVGTDYEEGAIILTVSVGDDGGDAIRNYQASCVGGGETRTSSSSTSVIRVEGLRDDTAYVCTVTATNGEGVSDSSQPSEAIVPEALPGGLPIWLLYEATRP